MSDLQDLERHTWLYPNDYNGQLAYADCLREHGFIKDADRIQAWVAIVTYQSPEPEL